MGGQGCIRGGTLGFPPPPPLVLHPGLKIMPFKLTGNCRLRSKDGKFKPRSRKMQNLLLYNAKWSHLNKDKRDCRTFQLVKQFIHSFDACVEFRFLKKEFFNLTINMQLLYFITTVTSQVHSARHHHMPGYSALPSV